MAEIRAFLTLCVIAGCVVEEEPRLLEVDGVTLYRDIGPDPGLLTCDCDPTVDLPVTYTPVTYGDSDYCYQVTEYCNPDCDWPDISLVGRVGRWDAYVEGWRCRPFVIEDR